MAYSIAYRARAREELDTFGKDHGETFCAEVNAWLLQLADQAERNDSRSSIDVTRLLDELGQEQTASSWAYSWQRFLEASWQERIRALLKVLKSRCPPWEFRGSVQPFMVLGIFSCEVHVLYEIDHGNKRIIITMFSGLPGQA